MCIDSISDSERAGRDGMGWDGMGKAWHDERARRDESGARGQVSLAEETLGSEQSRAFLHRTHGSGDEPCLRVPHHQPLRLSTLEDTARPSSLLRNATCAPYTCFYHPNSAPD